MKKIFKLLRAAYSFRKECNQCLKRESDSAEYKLAKHYNDEIEKMEDSEMYSSTYIDDLIQHLNKDKANHSDSEDIQRLLATAVSFLEILKSVVKH